MFSHLSPEGNVPRMVDVSDKTPSHRKAWARSKVTLPADLIKELQIKCTKAKSSSKKNKSLVQIESTSNITEIYAAKGPIFQTAIIAGTMAVKNTAHLIPFCHPLPIEKCILEISLQPVTESISLSGQQVVVIDCQVQTFAKTGVEMEALVGASVAALTIYDMCKSYSQNIVISETKLIKKSGGKSDYQIEK